MWQNLLNKQIRIGNISKRENKKNATTKQSISD